MARRILSGERPGTWYVLDEIGRWMATASDEDSALQPAGSPHTLERTIREQEETIRELRGHVRRTRKAGATLALQRIHDALDALGEPRA